MSIVATIVNVVNSSPSRPTNMPRKSEKINVKIKAIMVSPNMFVMPTQLMNHKYKPIL